MAETHLSREAHQRLTQELEQLTTEGRVHIARLIETAREMGDLSENADYHAAKEDQGRMEGRIRQLQAMLREAVIVEDVSDDKVRPGSVVSLRYEGEDEVERYLVGHIEERREGVEVVSPGSPLGTKLLGARKGDLVAFEAPNGRELRVEVVDVG